jgi:BirA family biotin operon repressor/biotin-[acetyl-CoA-carboxylase] ligase
VNQPAPFSGPALAHLARFGRVHVLDTVTSTNDRAFELAGTREPALVVARRQTRGRGRFRRHWFSDSGSLTFSYLSFPDQPAQLDAITHVIGVALARALQAAAGVEARIRWPNDIVAKDRKLCGVLCERRREAVAVGVGLNVNQAEFPEDVPEAISVFQLTGRTFDPLELLDPVLAEFTGLMQEVAEAGTGRLMQEVKDRSAVLHRRVEVATLLRKHVGTVVDIDSAGRIVLRNDAGRIVVLSSGQARRLT